MNHPSHSGARGVHSEVQESKEPAAATSSSVPSDSKSVAPSGRIHKETLYWWLKLLLQPILFLLCGILVIVALGLLQRAGWLSQESERTGPEISSTPEEQPGFYICPMMCIEPRQEPGRCPVCGMELVPAPAGNAAGGSRSIVIEPAARRVAHIQTEPVRRASVARQIDTIGDIAYDEGNLKTLAAYVDGRIEALYADYTGVVVNKGDRLALVYSPKLYSSQVELLLARKTFGSDNASTLSRVVQSNRDLYQSARQRLLEFGMTEQQIAELEQAGEATSRLHLVAPISGTVIEKAAVEGQYVKEGQPIYRLADLSTVWLMLQLFPEDAAMIRYGQRVHATMQSLPGEEFMGRVAFIDPLVDPMTRTVGVRVVVPNDQGRLRVGDYARAAIEVPIQADGRPAAELYDEDLADKWISPRHPHVIRDAPGPCPVCGVDLVPASQFGFTQSPRTTDQALVLPRDAVLMAGENSVVYVETEPGRFEIREVVVGAMLGDRVVISGGVEEGEQVATRGNFLIDSQMQLAGNPSLIDPTKFASTAQDPEHPSAEIAAALAQLSPEDRALAESQRICPVSEQPLGSMGVPPKVEVGGREVFICCEGCREPLLQDPDKYLAKLQEQEDAR